MRELYALQQDVAYTLCGRNKNSLQIRFEILSDKHRYVVCE